MSVTSIDAPAVLGAADALYPSLSTVFVSAVALSG